MKNNNYSKETKRSVLILATALISVGCFANGLVGATTPIITETINAASGSFPNGITTTSDGNIWFSEQSNNKIGFVNNDGTGYKEYPQAPFSGGNPDISPSSEPEGITVGPDTNLWFSEFNQNKIGALDTNGVLVHEYSITGGAGPQGITVGPNSNIWFAEHNAPAIGTIHTDGTNYNETSVTFNPTGITSAGGNIWFTESNPGNTSSAIGDIAPNGTLLHEYALLGNAAPVGITSDSSGNIWFTESGINKIGEMNASNGSIIKEISLKSGAAPSSLVFGADGNLWFTETGSDSIGTVSPDGIGLQEFDITSGSGPLNITAGINRDLWFTESTRDVIGQVHIPLPSPSNSLPASSSAKTPKAPQTGLASIGANPIVVLLSSLSAGTIILLILKRYSKLI